MYFIARSLRFCSRYFRATPSGLRLYRDGALVGRGFANQSASYFVVHPERLKQIIKERDAHMLCKFLDSEEYKEKVMKFKEIQSRIMARELESKAVKYQHVMSCAEPNSRKVAANEKMLKKKAKKPCALDMIINKKANKEDRAYEGRSSADYLQNTRKKLRHKTTIMPIFLKKMRLKQEQSAEESGNEYMSSRPLRAVESFEYSLKRPPSSSILQRSNLSSKKSFFSRRQKVDTTPSITTKLCPKKCINLSSMNLKSYSQLLLTEPVKTKSSKIDISKKPSPKRYVVTGDSQMVISMPPTFKHKVVVSNKSSKAKNMVDLSTKRYSVEMLAEETASKKVEDNLERKHTMNAIVVNKRAKKKGVNGFKTLFEKVKNGTAHKQPAATPPELEVDSKPAATAVAAPRQSYTYKSYTRVKQSKEASARAREEPSGWKMKVLKWAEKPPETVPKERVVQENITRNLHHPIPHFVKYPHRQQSQCHGYYKYSSS